MSMNRTVAKLRITRELHQAEAALNEALLKQSSLFTTLVTARRDAGDTAFDGQDVLLRLVRSQQQLLTAGNDLSRVHRGLLRIDGARDAETGLRIERCPPPAGLGVDQIRAEVA